MSVIGRWGSGGGGGASSSDKIKRPYVGLVQSGNTAQSHFVTFTFTKTVYVESLEVHPLTSNGTSSDDMTINTRIDGLTFDGVEQWFRSVTKDGGRLHRLSNWYGTAVPCLKLYTNYARLDAVSLGVRLVLRGYTLEDS